MSLSLTILRDRIGWFGNHTGYEQLTTFLATVDDIATTSIAPRNRRFPRLVGKLTSLALGHGSINQPQAAARLQAFVRLSINRCSLLHILYGEEHAPYWKAFPQSLRCRTVITIHQPSSQWTDEALANLRWIRQAILLYRRDWDFFRAAMPNAAIHFIPHGADVAFFQPAEPTASRPERRVLYNGVHLRNTQMLQRILPEILNGHPDTKFDFLVPEHRRDKGSFGSLLQHPAITWHAGLDDADLRDLYQNAHFLLLPMNDSGANTAVVEALASGIPIVTTDVGGIRDYGGGSIYPIVANDDDRSLLEIIRVYLTDRQRRDAVGIACRQFAERELAWPVIAARHLEVYKTISTLG